MRILYFDCFSGISGDMILGALIDLGLDLGFLKRELEKLNLKGIKISAKRVVKSGISSLKFDVKSGRHIQEERSLNEINKVIENSKLGRDLKNTIKKVFLNLAEAEAKIHNKPLNKVHFHELGAVDTIIDVAGAAIGIKKLGVEKVYCSKLNVGSGIAEFSHGRFPVPAPAAAEILRGAAIYSSGAEAELVTPTGAAIIRNLASGFGELPSMKIEKIGYGAGSTELSQPNVLRAYLGEAEGARNEEIKVIETNIDNMNPEFYPYVIDLLMENGALDAYLTNIIMKKGRPAVKLTVLADAEDAEKLSGIIFSETTTLGIRITGALRKKLERGIKQVKTKYGIADVKFSKLGGTIRRIAPEHDDCARIAKSKKVPLWKVYREVEKKAGALK